MATRIEPFEVLTPRGTLEASFQRTALPFQDGRVERIEILVPPGPSGLVGFKVAHSNQSVIPISSSTWNIADGVKFDWQLTNFPTGDAWELWTYNTDVYDHTLYLWFHVHDFEADSVPMAVPLAITPGGAAEHGTIDFGDVAGSDGGAQ